MEESKNKKNMLSWHVVQEVFVKIKLYVFEMKL